MKVDMIRRITFLCLLLAAALLVGMMALSCSRADRSAQIEMHKRLAGELDNNNLPLAAVEEYQKALALDGLSDPERGSLCYLIARIYYEGLKDYKSAAAYYIRAKGYDPQGSYATEASRNLVASLEKIGNVLDARRHLDASTNVDHKAADQNDVVVARFGGREIWLSEVEDQIRLLPADVQSQLTSRQAKLEYVHQYVGVELLYAAALREDYLSKPEIQKQRELMEKRLVVDNFVSEKVMPGVQVDTADLRNFYVANRDSLYHGAPLDSVKSQVWHDYQSRKAETAYNEYIMHLAQAEKVEFLDQNVR
jgi:tetratricopeptide (TPR) repeat protein